MEDIQKEIEQLKDECLKKDGAPRKNCDRDKLFRLIELQAQVPDGPITENAPENVGELQEEYDKLVNRIFDREDEDGPKIKKGTTAKQLSRFWVLKDMIRQPAPKEERISVKSLPGDKTEVKVAPGAPVVLEGKNEEGWKVLARIMPNGGKVVVKDYTAFRIQRGTDKPPHIEARMSNPNPNKNKVKARKAKFDI